MYRLKTRQSWDSSWASRHVETSHIWRTEPHCWTQTCNGMRDHVYSMLQSTNWVPLMWSNLHFTLSEQTCGSNHVCKWKYKKFSRTVLISNTTEASFDSYTPQATPSSHDSWDSTFNRQGKRGTHASLTKNQAKHINHENLHYYGKHYIFAHKLQQCNIKKKKIMNTQITLSEIYMQTFSDMVIYATVFLHIHPCAYTQSKWLLDLDYIQI